MIRTTVGFIGAGHMAGAIIQGMVDSSQIERGSIGVYDINPEQTKRYGYGHLIYDTIPELVKGSRVVFLSVKPQTIDQVLPLVKEGMRRETIVVSIAAGATADRLQKALGKDCKLLLAMPNTPMELGVGAVALSRVPPTTEGDFQIVKELLSTCSLVEEIPSHLLNEVIPVNGSSPAFFYRMAQIVMEEAENMGLEGEAALRLFCKTMEGSAAMLLRSGEPEKLVHQVATPGGTTAAALTAMEKEGFDRSLRVGMQVCVQRARELNQKG